MPYIRTVDTVVVRLAPIAVSWIVSEALNGMIREYLSHNTSAFIRGGVYGVFCQGGMKLIEAPENNFCIVGAATQYVLDYLGR